MAVTKAMHRIVSGERCRAFPEMVGPRIVWLESVGWKNDSEANWYGVVSFHCMQMSLVLSMRFIFGDE